MNARVNPNNPTINTLVFCTQIAPLDGTFPLLIDGTISSPLLGSAAETIINREITTTTLFHDQPAYLVFNIQ